MSTIREARLPARIIQTTGHKIIGILGFGEGFRTDNKLDEFYPKKSKISSCYHVSLGFFQLGKEYKFTRQMSWLRANQLDKGYTTIFIRQLSWLRRRQLFSS
jgi:hypothetical protein